MVWDMLSVSEEETVILSKGTAYLNQRDFFFEHIKL